MGVERKLNPDVCRDICGQSQSSAIFCLEFIVVRFWNSSRAHKESEKPCQCLTTGIRTFKRAFLLLECRNGIMDPQSSHSRFRPKDHWQVSWTHRESGTILLTSPEAIRPHKMSIGLVFRQKLVIFRRRMTKTEGRDDKFALWFLLSLS